MEIGKTVKKLITGTAVVGIACVIFSHASFAQLVEKREFWRQDFISREYYPRWPVSNENLANYDMRRYPSAVNRLSINPVDRGPITPVAYDPFGNFLLPGGEILSMSWDRSRIGASQSQSNQWARNIFNNLMISADEMGNWQTRFMLTGSYRTGFGVRTYFTPSTLKQTNFAGARWDASSRKNNFSLVASTGSTPLYGVHWESILGDIMKLGATFVSKQRGTISYSHQDIDRDIKDEPRYIYVIITDDSPEDTGAGAVFYDIKAIINGKEEPLPRRVFKISDVLTRKRYFDDEFQPQYIFKDRFWSDYYEETRTGAFLHRDESQDRNDRGSWFLSLLNSYGSATRKNILADFFHKSGEIGSIGYMSLTKEMITGNIEDRYDPDVINPATGMADIEYQRFFKTDMSAGHVEAEGSDLVIVEFEVPHGTRDLAFNVLVSNDYCIDIIAALYSRLQDSEASWYDEPLSDLWRGNWSIHRYDQKHGIKARGNVKDNSNMNWEKVRYDRITGMNVYGMNMELDWRGLFVRAEFNEYNTYWSYPLAEKRTGGKRSKYSTRAWFVNAEKDFGRLSIGAELFNYPSEYMQYMATIDDNDDDDRFVGGAEYPGLDNDFDRYIDTTWQGEPFLDYYYDTITIGDDFNHNGTIDTRENDNQIDLPYERDSRGQHYFLKLKPRLLSLLTFGHYDVEQEYLEGRNVTQYMKIEQFKRIRGIGEFLFYNRTERIKDDYKLDEGHHRLLNNWTTTNILNTRLNFIPHTNIINNFRYNTVYQVGDLLHTDGTEDERIRSFLSIYNDNQRIKRYGNYDYALEHKVDYTLRIADYRLIPEVSIGGFRLWREKRIKEIQFMPQIKIVHSYGYEQPNNLAIHRTDRKTRTLNVYPIIRFDYRVAPNTLLRFAVQGFSGFPEIFRTRTFYRNKLYDYDKKNLVFAFENYTLYQGFNLLVMMGVRYSKINWINDPSKIDPGATEYFITVQSEASR